MQEQLFEYVSIWYTDGRSERTVRQGRRSFVERFIPRAEFGVLFGGFCQSADDNDKEFLGVWGRRKCQHFRRVLRERGAEFVIIRENPGLRIRVQSTQKADVVVKQVATFATSRLDGRR